MFILTTVKGQHGPYAAIEKLADRWRCDGAELPFTVVGEAGDVTAWDGQPLLAPGELERLQAAAVAVIDADADEIRSTVLGGRATEYQQALQEAQAFAAGGYAGAAPEYVASWRDAKNAAGAAWSAQQAAEDILATGQGWLMAQAGIRRARLLMKELVRAAPTVQILKDTMAAWAEQKLGFQRLLGLAPPAPPEPEGEGEPEESQG